MWCRGWEEEEEEREGIRKEGRREEIKGWSIRVEKSFLGKTNSMGADLEFRNIHAVFERLKKDQYF